MAGVWARGASKKIWNPLRIFATVEASNFKFGTQFGFGTSLPKTIWTKIGGSGLGEHPKKLGPFTCFCKFRTQLGFGTRLPKNNVLDQNWLGCGPEEHPKNWDPLRIFATVEASNFKFGTQLGFGTSLPKTTFKTKISGGLG